MKTGKLLGMLLFVLGTFSLMIASRMEISFREEIRYDFTI